MKNRELLIDLGCEDASFFVDPDFDEAIIGRTEDGAFVYDYDMMVCSLAQEYMKDGTSKEDAEQDAVDWIEYNTIRTIPYMPEPRPVIIHSIGKCKADQ